MYQNLFIFAIGVVFGLITMFLIVKSEIGDEYDIYKPKQKGKDNSMKIHQKNNKPKKHILKRLFTKNKTK